MEKRTDTEHTYHVMLVCSKPTKRGWVVLFPVLLGFSPDRCTFKSKEKQVKLPGLLRGKTPLENTDKDNKLHGDIFVLGRFAFRHIKEMTVFFTTLIV